MTGNVENRRKNCIRLIVVFIAMLLLVTACKGKVSESGEKVEPTDASEQIDTGFVVAGPDSYDSADTAIVVDYDRDENTITFLNLVLGRRYTLSMDGTTRLYDKYGEGISLRQVQIGDIVDVTFLESKKHLTTLTLSTSAWTYSIVEKYEINSARGEISIGEDVYKTTSNTQYLSEDKQMGIQDINPSDVLSFQGIGNEILTVRVQRGHGYLRLVNDENFVGGWIEIGQTMVQRITEDMLLLVPEGSYQVNISNKGGGGIKNVKIERDEETVLDIGDLEIPEPQYGMVLFSLDPSNADLYIDGSKADPSGPVQLLYGLHQLIARAEGYQSVTQYIKVGQESAGINIVLDANADEQEESSEASEASGEAVTDYYKIYIDAPQKVEVYLDGNYVGISPCSVRKVAGAHVITLRQTGYETRSYTIQAEDDKRDLSFSFADLIPLEESSEELSKELSEGVKGSD